MERVSEPGSARRLEHQKRAEKHEGLRAEFVW
jgi:hypothetical protein